MPWEASFAFLISSALFTVPDFDGFEINLGTVCLFQVIHDDRNLGAKHSAIEVVIGKRRLLRLHGGLLLIRA